jgi:hypothetical protein
MSSEERLLVERTRRSIVDRWGDKFDKPQLRGKLGFDETLGRLITLCTISAPENFPEYVNRLFYSIPDEWKDEELWEAVDEATESYEVTTPTLCCGVPVKSDRIAPNVEVTQETDYHKLFSALLACCNRRGLLIPQVKREIIPADHSIPEES